MTNLNKRWLGRALRLSVVIGCLSAVWHSWTVFQLRNDDAEKWAAMRTVYECAARVEDDRLVAHANQFGNINVRGFFCSDRDFMVSHSELRDVRNGVMRFETSLRPFDLDGTIVAAVSGIVVTLLVSLLLLISVNTGRWIWVSR